MKKISGESLDITKLNIEKLKELFPNVVADGKVDFDMLKSILGENIENSSEKYQFSWGGKIGTIKYSQTPSTATLIPLKENSVNWDNTENLYIEGDNEETLKLLQKTYFGKIKMIYIDPPYNTGKDFIYKDDFKNTIENYKILTSQENRANPDTNGRFHTDWLNMMYSRLMLARNLLKDDGVIFISIDENEIFNLINICNEIYGEYNFVENFIWIKNSTKNLSKTTSTNHEYIVCYAKNKEKLEEINFFKIKKPGLDEVNKILEKANEEGWSIEFTEDKLKKFYKENPDLKGISNYNKVDYRKVEGSEQMHYQAYRLSDASAPKAIGKADTYEVIHPKTGLPCKSPTRGWAFTWETMQQHIKNNLIYFYDDETHVPQFKRYLDTVTTEIVKSTFEDFTDGKKELMRLFDGKAYFENAKPTTLLTKFISFTKSNDIILDFFSGSGTTADAVMKLNAEDNGNRKFILVQLPELCDEKSEAFKNGYKNICEIGEERIRRSGQKIYNELKEKYDNAGQLVNDYVNPDSLDFGFKVFKLDSSNIKPWDGSIVINENELRFFEDTIKEDRTNLDVAYEIMLKYGIFNMPLKEVQINNKNMYSIGEGYMIICLNKDITLDDVVEIANLKPHCVVFKEQGFDNDNEKINATYTLERLGVEDIKCI